MYDLDKFTPEQRVIMEKMIANNRKAIREDLQFHLDMATGKPKPKKHIKTPLESKMDKMLRFKSYVLNIFNPRRFKDMDAVEIEIYKKAAYIFLKDITDFLAGQLKEWDDNDD